MRKKGGEHPPFFMGKLGYIFLGNGRVDFMKRILFLCFLILCILLVICRANRVENKNPVVSVVMPVYNREDLVRRAVESILNQTYTQFEFVIVNDGSTDKTGEILQEYAQKDDRIRIITNEQNCGIACARNVGMAAAKGKYIAPMDSDDMALPIRLEKSVAAMEAFPDIAVFSGRIGNIEKEMSLEWIQNPKEFWIDRTPEFLQIQMMFTNDLQNVATILRRDFFEKEKIKYNEKYLAAEDYDLWKQVLLKGGKIAGFGNVVTIARFHNSNAPDYYASMVSNTNQIKKELFEQFFAVDIKEIKWNFSEIERCLMLEKVAQGNAERLVMSPQIIDDFKQQRCPPANSNWVYVKHPKWKSFVVLGQNAEAQRHASKVRGTYVWDKDNLKIEWEKEGSEMFKKQKDGIYHFFEIGVPGIDIKHPNWSDKFITKGNRFCRKGFTDCGQILSRTPNEIRVKWDRWGIETFKKRSKTQTFEYVECP